MFLINLFLFFLFQTVKIVFRIKRRYNRMSKLRLKLVTRSFGYVPTSFGNVCILIITFRVLFL